MSLGTCCASRVTFPRLAQRKELSVTDTTASQQINNRYFKCLLTCQKIREHFICMYLVRLLLGPTVGGSATSPQTWEEGGGGGLCGGVAGCGCVCEVGDTGGGGARLVWRSSKKLISSRVPAVLGDLTASSREGPRPPVLFTVWVANYKPPTPAFPLFVEHSKFGDIFRCVSCFTLFILWGWIHCKRVEVGLCLHVLK